MGFSENYNKPTTHESWGLGLFLVFFPNDGNKIKFLDKKKIVSSTNSLFSFTATTILCGAALIFFTLCVFTLSNLDDNLSLSSPTTTRLVERTSPSSTQFALQGMGTLFRRGTRAMADLVVAHLDEALEEDDFRVFLRTIHLSGITARADLLLLYNGERKKHFHFLLIEQENESFLKLLQNSTSFKGDSFDLSLFRKERRQGKEANLWGRKNRTNNSSSSNSEGSTELNGLNYGSVVGFDVSELDPADLLSGFFDKPPPIRLRRWACYQMLLGRVRRNFKHVMLVDPKDVILLSDSLTKVRHRGAESVHLWRNTRAHKSVTADVIVGGIRGIRWLSNAMLNEIVRASMNRKSKNAMLDSGILSQLVNNESLLKSLSIVTNTESAIQSASAVVVSMKNSSGLSSLGMLHRGNSKNVDVNYILRREMCLFVLDSFVYRDCYKKIIV